MSTLNVQNRTVNPFPSAPSQSAAASLLSDATPRISPAAPRPLNPGGPQTVSGSPSQATQLLAQSREIPPSSYPDTASFPSDGKKGVEALNILKTQMNSFERYDPETFSKSLKSLINFPVSEECRSLRDGAALIGLFSPIMHLISASVPLTGAASGLLALQQERTAQVVVMMTAVDTALKATDLEDFSQARATLENVINQLSELPNGNAALAGNLRESFEFLQDILGRRQELLTTLPQLKDDVNAARGLVEDTLYPQAADRLPAIEAKLNQLKENTAPDKFAFSGSELLAGLEQDVKEIRSGMASVFEAKGTKLTGEINRLFLDMEKAADGKLQMSLKTLDDQMVKFKDKLTEAFNEYPGLDKTFPDLAKRLETWEPSLAVVALINNPPKLAGGATLDSLQSSYLDFHAQAEELKQRPDFPENLRAALEAADKQVFAQCLESALAPHAKNLEQINDALSQLGARITQTKSDHQGPGLAVKNARQPLEGLIESALKSISREIGALGPRTAGGDTVFDRRDQAANIETTSGEAGKSFAQTLAAALREKEQAFLAAAAGANLLKRTAAILDRGGSHQNAGKTKTIDVTLKHIEASIIPPDRRQTLRIALAGGALGDTDRAFLQNFLEAALTGREKRALCGIMGQRNLTAVFVQLAKPGAKLSPDQAAALTRFLDVRGLSPEKGAELIAEVGKQSTLSYQYVKSLLDNREKEAMNGLGGVPAGSLRNLNSRLADLRTMGEVCLLAADLETLNQDLNGLQERAAVKIFYLTLSQLGGPGQELLGRIESDPVRLEAFRLLIVNSWGNLEVAGALARMTPEDQADVLLNLGRGGDRAAAALDKLLLANPGLDEICLELKLLHNGKVAGADGQTGVILSANRLTAGHEMSRAAREIRSLLLQANPSGDNQPLTSLLAQADGAMLANLASRLNAAGRNDSELGLDLQPIDLLILRAHRLAAQAASDAPASFAEFQSKLPPDYQAAGRPHLEDELRSGLYGTYALNQAGATLEGISTTLFRSEQFRNTLAKLGKTPDQQNAESVLRASLTNLFGYEAVKNKNLRQLGEMLANNANQALGAAAVSTDVAGRLKDRMLKLVGSKEDSAFKSFEAQMAALAGLEQVVREIHVSLERSQVEIGRATDYFREQAEKQLATLAEIDANLPADKRAIAKDGINLDKVEGKQFALSLAALRDIVDNPPGNAGPIYGSNWEERKKLIKEIGFQTHLDFTVMRGGEFGITSIDPKSKAITATFNEILKELKADKSDEATFKAAGEKLIKFFDDNKLQDKIEAVIFFKKSKKYSVTEDLTRKAGQIFGNNLIRNNNTRDNFRDRFISMYGQLNAAGSKAVGSHQQFSANDLEEFSKNLKTVRSESIKRIATATQNAIIQLGHAALTQTFLERSGIGFEDFLAAVRNPKSPERREVLTRLAAITGGEGKAALPVLELYLGSLDKDADIAKLASDIQPSTANRVKRFFDNLTTPGAVLDEARRTQAAEDVQRLCAMVKPGATVAIDLKQGVVVSQELAAGPELGLELAFKHGFVITAGLDGEMTLDLSRGVDAKLEAKLEFLNKNVSAEAEASFGAASGYRLKFQDDPEGGRTAKDKLENFITLLCTGQANKTSLALASSLSALSSLSAGFKVEVEVNLAGIAKNAAGDIAGQAAPAKRAAETGDVEEAEEAEEDDDDGDDDEKDAVELKVAAGFSASVSRQVEEEGNTRKVSYGYEVSAYAKVEASINQETAVAKLKEKDMATEFEAHAAWNAACQIEQTTRNDRLTGATQTTTKKFAEGEVDNPQKAVAIARRLGINNPDLLADLEILVAAKVPVSLSVNRSLLPSAVERLANYPGNDLAREFEFTKTRNYKVDGFVLQYDVSKASDSFKFGGKNFAIQMNAEGSITRSRTYFAA